MTEQISASPNFGHLADLDTQLARLGALAEQFFDVDANSSLVKARQFAERMATLVAARSSIVTDDRDTFVEILRRLKYDDVITEDVAGYFHKLRKIGNLAVHEMGGERKDAFEALKMSHVLGVWFRMTVTGRHPAQRKFIPPKFHQDDSKELKAQIAELQETLRQAEGAAEQAARETQEAIESKLTAEERAAKALEEQLIWEALAQEAEHSHAQLAEEAARLRARAEEQPEEVERFKKAAKTAAQDVPLDEMDTRLLIDEQLRNRGWDVDSSTLTYSAGIRPAKSKNLAIAEWPTSSGPADYALFVGEKLIAFVEAKRMRVNVSEAIDQAERYARDVDWSHGGAAAGGPWGEFLAPFVFSTNGRGYLHQLRTESGIWFRDVRRLSNARYPLPDWPTPEGLAEKLDVDQAAAEASLERRDFTFGFELRPYQIKAIEAVEENLAGDNREMLLAMATGTGKTKLAIAMAYRLLEAKRFQRLCFVVDRSALGEQAFQAFDTTRMVGAKTFADIFGLKGLNDRDIGRDTKVHICTIQGLVHRVLASAPEDRLPVDQYDLMIIDECHRGYLLDREMSDAEMSFRDEDDYISKYRRVLDYFDATKIGLTATPALHTTQIFGQPIYRYGYRDAVVDGYLIDHDPPHLITTALSAAGITFERGETVELLNRETGEIDLAELDDHLDFQVQHFNKKVLTPAFNRVVAEELVKRIDPWLDGKTLIFATTNDHADRIVDALRLAYREAGEDIEDGMIRKITGSVDKVSDVIRSYKNDRFPNIAVTVDLLTTGIDVPAITNLVFLRRVNSRILYDQMIGRATRRCDDIGKEVFQIYDAVDLYPQLQNLTEMRPVVVNPAVTFEELFDGLEQADEAAHQEQIVDQIIVKLDRKVRKIGEEQRQQYEAETGEAPERTLERFRNSSAGGVRDWVRDKPGIGTFFDFTGERNGPPILPISQHDDRVIAVTRGYGDGVKPEDFIESFSAFVRDNQNKIAALQTVLTRPRDLTRAALKELRAELDRLHFTEPNLRTAWRDRTNDDVAASIIGFVRQAALGDPLIPYGERIDRATRAIATRRKLSSPQRRWLERIAEELKRQTLLDEDAFNQQPFAKDGGFLRFNKIFKGELEQLLLDIQDEAWKPAA